MRFNSFVIIAAICCVFLIFSPSLVDAGMNNFDSLFSIYHKFIEMFAFIGSCSKFGVSLPGTECSSWCVMPSPIGSCGGSDRCCISVG